ncbi:MAG: hypothetical protein E6H49_01880 [Betaproteobacteria bacterium]|nr:MAG: hypothetical protein E6H49_01880 [Betaproteobacteria bacterium]
MRGPGRASPARSAPFAPPFPRARSGTRRAAPAHRTATPPHRGAGRRTSATAAGRTPDGPS